MNGKNFPILFLFIFFALNALAFSFYYARAQESAVIISALVQGCGNGIKETGEQCDNADLGGQTCAGLGYSNGVLSCNFNCAFNVSNCVSGGGGGGGGGGGFVIQPTTSINFSGRAYPKSAVTLLKDAQIVATTVAGTDANFQINITELSGGNYIFSLYGEDKTGRRSSLLTFPVSVTKGAITSISGIFIAPTIAVDKSKVKRGDNVAIFGLSAPQADITILVHSGEELFFKTNSDNNGIYLYNLDTAILETGEHLTKSKTALNGEISSFSKAVSFTVGTETIIGQQDFLKGDLNNDNKVNLIDFSIAAYWYKRIINAEFAIKEINHLNGDGKIDLVDFSIMAYYWTG